MLQLCKKIHFALSLIIVTLLITPNAQADQQKIVLLTSINTRSLTSIFGKSYFKSYVPKLEEYFRRKFESSRYIIEIVNQADQFHLWSALHDPRNVAVFWISHASAGPSGAGSQALISTHQVLDYHGFEVTPIFEKVHPNLRFLAVIGCFTESAVGKLPTTSEIDQTIDRPYLRVFTFNHKIEARKGLKQAIAQAKNILDIPEIRLGYPSQCTTDPGYQVQVTRYFNPAVPTAVRPAARIMMGPIALDAFPKSQTSSGENPSPQSHLVFLPKLKNSLPDLRLDVGDNGTLLNNRAATRVLDLGSLEIRLVQPSTTSLPPPETMPWNLWKARNGKPIGVFTRSYKPSHSAIGGLDLSKYESQGSEFDCLPMPPY